MGENLSVLEQLSLKNPDFVWSDKIELTELPGRGMSVLCREPIKPNELLIRVPPKMLINTSTISSNKYAELDLETHDLLALELLERRDGKHDGWVESLPESFDFMPVLWDPELQKRLPERYQKIIEGQNKEIQKLASLTDLPENDIAWGYMAVNSRCLYWPRGGMTLAPAIDYLNHTCDQEESLNVSSELHTGISVKSTKSYSVGDELVFCYGPHENGKLLAEYGFVVPNNPWDFADITPELEVVLKPHESFLHSLNYWGDWTLDLDGEPSYRVIVAMASLQAPDRKVKLLAEGYTDDTQYAEQTRKELKLVIEKAFARYEDSAETNEMIRVVYAQYRNTFHKYLDL